MLYHKGSTGDIDRDWIARKNVNWWSNLRSTIFWPHSRPVWCRHNLEWDWLSISALPLNCGIWNHQNHIVCSKHIEHYAYLLVLRSICAWLGARQLIEVQAKPILGIHPFEFGISIDWKNYVIRCKTKISIFLDLKEIMAMSLGDNDLKLRKTTWTWRQIKFWSMIFD